MEFIVLGYDGDDEQALARRLAVREAHLAQAHDRFAAGDWLYAGALLSDDGKMVGSFIVCDYPSREALESQWLRSEPYVVGDVWRRIEIRRAQIPPALRAPKP